MHNVFTFIMRYYIIIAHFGRARFQEKNRNARK